MDGEALPADRRRTGEDDRLAVAPEPLQRFEDEPVVEERVIVVHLLGIRAVEIDDLCRDAFAEIGLETVDAHGDQAFKMPRVPCAGLRVGEIDDAHARLPFVPLPDGAIGTPQQIALGHALVEKLRSLGDVGIDPDADTQALGLEPGEHALRIGERRRVPFEVAPVLAAHPEAIEVENMQRQIALAHPVDEAIDGLLVVVGGERRRQPESERPWRRQGGPAGQPCVAVEDVLGRRAVDDQIFEGLAFDREADLRHEFRADFERHPFRLVDQHAPAAVGEEEGNVLVGLLGARAAVLIPDFDGLAVAGERRESLAEPIHEIADAEIEPFEDVGPARSAGSPRSRRCPARRR